MKDQSIHQWLEKRSHLLKPIHKFILTKLMDEGVQNIYHVNLENWKFVGGMEAQYLFFAQMRDSFYVIRDYNNLVDIPRLKS